MDSEIKPSVQTEVGIWTTTAASQFQPVSFSYFICCCCLMRSFYQNQTRGERAAITGGGDTAHYDYPPLHTHTQTHFPACTVPAVSASQTFMRWWRFAILILCVNSVEECLLFLCEFEVLGWGQDHSGWLAASPSALCFSEAVWWRSSSEGLHAKGTEFMTLFLLQSE